jgi:hypothetical protein
MVTPSYISNFICYFSQDYIPRLTEGIESAPYLDSIFAYPELRFTQQTDTCLPIAALGYTSPEAEDLKTILKQNVDLDIYHS